MSTQVGVTSPRTKSTSSTGSSSSVGIKTHSSGNTHPPAIISILDKLFISFIIYVLSCMEDEIRSLNVKQAFFIFSLSFPV